MRATIIFTIIIAAVFFFESCSLSIPNDAVFTYTTTGGFVQSELAKQVLIIEPGKLTYTVYSTNEKVTIKIEKQMNETTYQDVKKTFEDNKFLSFKDNYTTNMPVLDAGRAEIQMTTNNGLKKVRVDPNVAQEYPLDVKAVMEKMQELITKVLEMNEDDAKTFAASWIKNAPTYAYDGQELVLKEITKIADNNYQLTYSFKTNHSGYGNRTDTINSPIPREHDIIIIVNKWTVTSANIDNKWDEVRQQQIRETEGSNETSNAEETSTHKTGASTDGTILFQPTQCDTPPWETWYNKGDLKMIKAPTETEIIALYYQTYFKFKLTNVTRHERTEVSCDACSVCPKGYYYTAQSPQASVLLKLGWEVP
jgi:hypothetical protein